MKYTKEQLRMQQIAGIITESQYKKLIKENKFTTGHLYYGSRAVFDDKNWYLILTGGSGRLKFHVIDKKTDKYIAEFAVEDYDKIKSSEYWDAFEITKGKYLETNPGSEWRFNK